MNRRSFRALLAFLTPSLLAVSAHAHVRMTYPDPRYPVPDQEMGQQQKDGPCGVTNDSRVEERVTVFEPGETITVTFNETIDHPGFFRISFDDDGQDAFQFPTSRDDVVDPPVLPVLVDDITDKGGGMYSQEITLPNIECENCTLQLIQVMKAGDGPFVEGDIYYQCADIALRGSTGAGGTGGTSGAGGTGGATGGAAGSSGGGASGGTAGSGGAGAGGAGAGGLGGPPGTGGATSAGGSGTGAGAGGLVGTGGGSASGGTSAASAEDQGGCSISNVPSGADAWGWVGLGVLLAAGRRRSGRGVLSRLSRR